MVKKVVIEVLLVDESAKRLDEEIREEIFEGAFKEFACDSMGCENRKGDCYERLGVK